MSIMPVTSEQQLSELLGCTIAELDISTDDYLAAQRRYVDVGTHLKNEGVDVYVQGSVLLVLR